MTYTELNENEASLVLDALNNYWHTANNELKRTDLGDIERDNWSKIRLDSGKLMRKLGAF